MISRNGIWGFNGGKLLRTMANKHGHRTVFTDFLGRRCLIPGKRWTTSGKAGKSTSFKVFIHYLDDHIEGKKLFADPLEANRYFEELCAQRTVSPASVVGLTGQNIRKYYRIDEICQTGRAVLDLEWI
jgi:hypothetical protein